MAYNIPISSGLRIPNDANLTDEQREALGKLYLLHSKYVEVDGKKVLGENVQEEHIDLSSLLGQLVKTVGAVQWNKSGLNGVTPDERVYPEDALSREVQEQIDKANADMQLLLAELDEWKGKLAASIQDNYLDNSNFARPINQRGKTEYLCNGDELYTIDRWFLSENGASITLSQNGISIDSGMLFERFEMPTYSSIWTFIAEPVEGDRVALVVDFGSAVSFESDDGKLMVSVADGIGKVGLGAGTWKSIGMYPGNRISNAEESYVYIPKSYEDEFATCLRYFYRFDG